MNDKARGQIAYARLRVTEGDYALAEDLRRDSFPERLAAIAVLLGKTSYAASLSTPWAWQLVAEVYCHVTDLPEPGTFRRKEPLHALGHALGLPEEEHDAAWSIVAGAWAWLLREVEGLQRLETAEHLKEPAA